MNAGRPFDRQRHDRTLELAAAGIDFDLTKAEVAELEAHLAGCPACARRTAALGADARILSRPITVPALARADAAVYAAIARRPVRQQRLLLLAAAALLLVALLGTAAVGAALLRTRDAVGSISEAQLGASLTFYILTYFTLFIAYMVVLTHMAGRGAADPHPPSAHAATVAPIARAAQ